MYTPRYNAWQNPSLPTTFGLDYGIPSRMMLYHQDNLNHTAVYDTIYWCDQNPEKANMSL